MEIVRFVCESCGAEPPKNEEKSNENWIVIDNNPCNKCGGKVEMKIK